MPVLICQSLLDRIMAGEKEEEASVMLRKGIMIFITLSILTFGFAFSAAAISFGGVIVDDSGIGVRVIHLLDRSLLYAVPGFDWDMKNFCFILGGEYYFTKDLSLHLGYSDWPFGRTMKYDSVIASRKRLYTAEAKIKQGKDRCKIGLLSGKLQTENAAEVGITELALGYTKYISEGTEENWKTVLVTNANYGWTEAGEGYLITEAKLVFNKNNFTVSTGIGHNTYSGRLMPCFDVGRILQGFPVDKLTGINMFLLTMERKYPLLTISTEEFKSVFSLPVFIELTGVQRGQTLESFTLYNRTGVGFSMNINDEVEFRVEAALLDGNVSKIVFHATTEIY
jgi:hypothetical protein